MDSQHIRTYEAVHTPYMWATVLIARVLMSGNLAKRHKCMSPRLLALGASHHNGRSFCRPTHLAAPS